MVHILKMKKTQENLSKLKDNESIIKKKFNIGEFFFEIQMPVNMSLPENMKLFEQNKKNSDYVYEIKVCDELSSLMKNYSDIHSIMKVIERERMHIWITDIGECRLLYIPGSQSPYAMIWEETNNITKINVAKNILPMMIYDTFFVSLLNLEKRMIERKALILHCAYICYNQKAVLFSAPSGVGKSTQADLWGKYRETKTINGDKALLLRENGIWYAYGWPVCGSSEICFNEKYPIGSIVMLYQAAQDDIKKLEGLAAVRQLFAQVTVNMWSSQYISKVMDQLENLISEVPIYSLGCTMTENAVTCLEKVL